MTYDEHSETAGIETLVVSVNDGTVFRCSPVAFGGTNAPYPPGARLRWNLERLSAPPREEERPAYTFVGPPIQPDRTPAAVCQLISEWWETRKSLGYANENAQTARDRLAKDIDAGVERAKALRDRLARE